MIKKSKKNEISGTTCLIEATARHLCWKKITIQFSNYAISYRIEKYKSEIN